MYEDFQINFEETYYDILNKAFRPLIRGPIDDDRSLLLEIIREAMGDLRGKVSYEGEEFFLRSRQGKIEFSLLAEGLRKLGLLYLLVQNGSLTRGSVLFWDEPESNLNPRLYKYVIRLLMELQNMGAQIFLATHDYVILKEIDLCIKEMASKGEPPPSIAFHSFHRDRSGPRRGQVVVDTSSNYLHINPNAIADTFDDLYDREVGHSLTEFRK